jgi:mono/diheme cytochrome c family protein
MKKYKIIRFFIIGVLCLSYVLTGCSGPTVPAAPAASGAKEKTPGDYIAELPEEWKSQPAAVLNQWASSRHAQEGTTCITCHGSDPQNIKKVSAKTCGTCHTEEFDEFSMSTHATSLVHAMSKDKTTYNGKEVAYKWQAYPEGGPDKWGCANCHSVGYISEEDGSLGDCATCHGGHLFSLEQARSPETCDGCHAGPGHPQVESYEQSRHGIAWKTLGKDYDLSGSTEEFWARQETDPMPAPTCQSCHMPDGTHYTSHGQAHDLLGARVEDYEEQITFMVENSCTNCHSEPYAREWLGNADEFATFSKNRIKEAKQMLEELRKDGLIRDTMEVTNAHPIAGELSAADSLWFRANMSTNRAFKGAFHMSSQWAGRQGWTDQSFDLMEFRSEIERLRADAKRDQRIKELEEMLNISE